MSHSFSIRVYYEDTDMGGIVYYANYLRYIERARSDWVRALGIDQNAMREQDGTVFVVRKLEAEYLAPAKFDDELVVRTSVAAVTGARLVLAQDVCRDGAPIFRARVTVVCVAEGGAPARLPAKIRQQVH
ncbi:tol-pal system-associated acyl-CoA thioesterase [Marivita sp. GX14005]|uniref:tol-pal system-associated acyl-CoA thioesterase n=1 Tax=Marivita sp. GX14005 TaxID=2942276 RepID=UPI002019D188|nr:tol-pal system-associated acyl-CoA thioesterase [Marivita sp. GX14005]MCL3880845.1 tol-pal system-associated acyl-CoA thioesterase [Marivita sp. GX14005]